MRIITSENETRLWWLFVFNIRENLVKKYFNPLKPDSARIVYEILPLQYADPDVEPMPKKMEVEIRDKDSVLVYGPRNLTYQEKKSMVLFWNGKDNTGKYTKPEKSPYLVTTILTYEQTGRRGETDKSKKINTKTTNTPIGDIYVVSAKNSEMPTDENKIVDFTDEVTLYGVIKAKIQEEPEEYRYYLGYKGEDYPTQAKIKNQIVNLERWNKELWGELELKWQKVQPKLTHDPGHSNDPNENGKPPQLCYNFYTNVDMSGVWLGGNGVFGQLEEGNTYDIIEYNHQDKESGWTVKNEPPSDQAGTQWYVFGTNFKKEELKMKKSIYASGERYEPSWSKLVYKSGLISKAEVAYIRGIWSNVHRISRRSGFPNNYISGIESYYGVPWIWASSSWGSDITTHQTERYVGFDCKDLAVGAYRAIGGNATYGSMNHVIGQTHDRGNWGRLHFDEEGKLRNESNVEVIVPIGMAEHELHVGDIIFIDFEPDGDYTHTTVLYEDNGNVVLDQDDKLIFATHEENGGMWSGIDCVQKAIRRYRTHPVHPHPDLRILIRHW